MNPLRTGIAFALTVAALYASCTLAWLAAPELFMGFVQALFHGMDPASPTRPAAFAWPGFLVALLVLCAWGLLAGALFAWLGNLLAVTTGRSRSGT